MDKTCRRQKGRRLSAASSPLVSKGVLGVRSPVESPVILLNQLQLMGCGWVFVQQSTPGRSPLGVGLLLDGVCAGEHGFISGLLGLMERGWVETNAFEVIFFPPKTFKLPFPKGDEIFSEFLPYSFSKQQKEGAGNGGWKQPQSGMFSGVLPAELGGGEIFFSEASS